jgi:hypothetical protein
MSDQPGGGGAGGITSGGTDGSNGPGASGGGTSSGGAKALKRYGPIVAIVVVIGVIVLIASLHKSSNKSNVSTANTTASNGSSLPLTYQEAQAKGDASKIDWGPHCDTTTGRIKLPLVGAPQCVEPWDSTKSNGGATYQGITATTIKIAQYVGQNDPLQQALIGGTGATTDPAAYQKTAVGFLNAFASQIEMYGRKLDIVPVKATGTPEDQTAAIADATKIIQEIKPFAVIGGPSQAPVFWQRIAKAHILCIGTCATADSEAHINADAPYVWPASISPEQSDDLTAELICKQLANKDATYAGDTSMHSKPRVWGYIQAQTTEGQFNARNARFFAEIKNQCGVTIKAQSTYTFDVSQAQEIARTIVNKMKAAGVTSVIVSTDPLIPANFTKEATAQNYFPEWVIGPTVLADTTLFARTFDQQQWSHALGIAIPPARGPRIESESYNLYKWYTGEEPPANGQQIPYGDASIFMIGVHLAGPNLTPLTFEQGMFRYYPAPGSALRPYVSWGTSLWHRPDYNSVDDVGIVWWDPNATGQDEVGGNGKGEYRYIDEGKRFLPGQMPTTPINFFDPTGTVTVLTQNPPGDTPPTYPSPAASGTTTSSG